jgi:hypothetical protein
MKQDKIIEFLKIFLNGDFIDSYLRVGGETKWGKISNSSLNGTGFHFDYKNKKLLHFTSLNNLKSILESESLHCSNFNEFSDRKEMLLAAENIFKISDLEKRKSKNGLFALSLTEMGDKDVKKSYEYHWKNYGNDFKGVALELEIIHFTDVYYPLSIKYVKNIEEEEIITKMKKCYDECFDDSSFNESLINFLYTLFSAFKVQEYQDEKEVRIFNLRTNSGNLPMPGEKGKNCIQFYINCNNEPVYYWNLPLSFPNDSESNSSSIRLNKIHIGRNAFDCNSDNNITAEIICIYLKRICDKKGIDLEC